MGIKLSTTNKNENHKNTIENQNVSEKNKRMRIETKSGREIGQELEQYGEERRQ